MSPRNSARRPARPLAGVFGSGSVLWLMAHDLRLSRRNLRISKTRAGNVALAILVLLVFVLHIAGFVSAPLLDALKSDFRTSSLMVATISIASVFALLMSKAISQVADALNERGDLDLLLSSPLPMQRVLIARLLAIAVNSAIMPILVILPLVNGMMLRGYFSWAGAYPVVVGLGGLAAGLAALLILGLLKFLGKRAAGFLARWTALAFGMASLLISQLKFIFSDLGQVPMWQRLQAQADDGGQGMFWWPARALMGETIPMVALALGGIAILLVASAMMGKTYAQGTTGTQGTTFPIGIHIGNATSSSAKDASGFGYAPLQALMVKEFTLLVRAPGLMGNVLYQGVFLIPGLFMARRVGEAVASDVRAAAVLLTVMTIGRVTRLCCAAVFSADDAAALCATAPVPAANVKLVKLMMCSVCLFTILLISLTIVQGMIPAALPAAALAATAAILTKLWLSGMLTPSLRRQGMSGRIKADATTLSGFVADLMWGSVGVALTWIL